MQSVSPHPSSTPGNSLTHTPKGACYVPYKIRPTVEINHHTEYIPNNGPCLPAFQSCSSGGPTKAATKVAKNSIFGDETWPSVLSSS